MSIDQNDFEKIQEILDYLMVEFPDSSIEHHYNGRRKAETFSLKHRNRQVLISFSSEFIEDILVDEIRAKLKFFHLASSIRQEKASHIIVTNSGLKFGDQE